MTCLKFFERLQDVELREIYARASFSAKTNFIGVSAYKLEIHHDIDEVQQFGGTNHTIRLYKNASSILGDR
jgi:hypothetical protein